MRKKDKEYTRKKVDLDFETIEQRDRFEKFLRKTGRKAGPFLTVLALEAMAKEA